MCAPNGFSSVRVAASSDFSVSGSRAMSPRPPTSFGVAKPAAISFSR
jgi:hypothetical protein